MQRQDTANTTHLLPSEAVLPLFDTLFGVALTLLAYSIPDRLMNSMEIRQLALLFGIYLLTGAVVMLYWYKLRRLIHATRQLSPPQLLLGTLSILLIVMMPKLTQLVATQGGGTGDFTNWTPSQIANTIYIFYLGCMDGLCYAYGRSLHRHNFVRENDLTMIKARSSIKLVGLCAIMTLGIAELISNAFNNQYILVVPIILLSEECFLSRRIKKNPRHSIKN